jgi:glycosyltransferase involved in cell wall biosynthesis
VKGLELRLLKFRKYTEPRAEACPRLLQNPEERDAVARAAVEMVRRRFSWENAARCLEDILAHYGRL